VEAHPGNPHAPVRADDDVPAPADPAAAAGGDTDSSEGAAQDFDEAEPPKATNPVPEASSEVPSERPLELPGTRELLSAGLDLCLKTNASLRTTSLAIGFQLLGTVGPLVVLVIVIASRAPEVIDALLDQTTTVTTSPEVAAVAGPAYLLLVIAGLALLALTIESRILAVSLLGGYAIGRPMLPLEALRRSRQVFWPVAGATFIIQVAVNIVVTFAGGVLGESEASVVLTTGLAALLSVPFVYLVSGIALGAAPAVEAIRRSIAMARVRWRLAIVVAVAETLAQTLLVLALLAGFDILARITDTLGLGLDSGAPTTFLTIVIALLATTAVGSLLFTVTALAAAPQVVAFVGLTRYGAGLDLARDAAPNARRVRWLSVPMAIGITVAVVTSVAGVAAALRGT
jgi:hypothetical protein